MTFKTISRAMALSAVATLGTAIGASAATCSISMPASGGNANVAAVNANIVSVLQAQYPGVAFDAPSATQGSSVEVPNCNAADFQPTGANISNVQGTVPGGAGRIEAGVGAALGVAVVAAILVFGDNNNNTTTTTNP